MQHAIEIESRQGQVAGYEVLDLKARLIDGKYHDVDSSALAFEIAGRACFRETQKLSKPKLLEPIMSLEVVTEATYLGVVRRLKTGTGVNLKSQARSCCSPWRLAASHGIYPFGSKLSRSISLRVAHIRAYIRRRRGEVAYR